MTDVEEPQWRVWWRRAFAAFLGLALVLGLWISYRPAGFSDEPEVATEDESSQAPTEAPDEDGESDEGDDGETTEPPPEEEPTEDGLTEEEIAELIDAARDPEETSVQVLDAGGGADAANDAAETLRELGYDVVAVNSSRVDYSTTTALFTEGNRAEAEAMRAREERVAEVAPNERLSDAVDVHLVVGPDWS